MFHSARLKLTAWYLLIIFCISLFFSLTVYQILTFEVDRFASRQRSRLESRMMESEGIPAEMRIRLLQRQAVLALDPELISEAKNRISLALLGLNVVILGLSGALSYFLAGKTLRPIQNMLEEQKRFVADASHELRTPITALKSSIEVHLRDGSMTLPDAKSLLNSAKDQVDRLSTLSDSLLELSSNDSSESTVKEDVDIAEVAQKVVSEMQPIASQKSCRVVLDQSEARVRISSHDLYRLTSILVDNAIKYSQHGGEVRVTISKNKKYGICMVADQGIGIPEADQKHIFDRFYRAEDARKSNGSNGYGLGLSIAKKIVDQYKGFVRVKSRPGHGATFVVGIPMT